MDQAKPIGLIGLQGDGPGIARRLAEAGHRVLAWDQNPALSRALKDARPHIEIAGSLFDIGADCEIVLVRLDGVRDLHEAIFGSEDRPGFGPALEPDSIIVDLVPKDPRELRRLVPVLGLRGLHLVDAVLLGAETAGGAEPHVIAGGFEPVVARVMPVLVALGKAERAGELGAAHALAILGGALQAVRHAATNETRAMAAALKVDSSRLDAVHGTSFEPGDATKLLALAAALAARTGTAVPLLTRAAEAVPEPPIPLDRSGAC